MFSFFKSNCRSFTDIFNNFTDDEFEKPRINNSLKTASIINQKLIQFKHITQIKYVPAITKKTTIKTPRQIIESQGIFSPTFRTIYDISEKEEIIKPAYLTNINHHGENIAELINSKLTIDEIEKYEIICSPSIKIGSKLQFDLKTLDSNKYYNIDINYKLTFMNNKFYIVFYVQNIQEIIIQHKKTLPFDEDNDPVWDKN